MKETTKTDAPETPEQMQAIAEAGVDLTERIIDLIDASELPCDAKLASLTMALCGAAAHVHVAHGVPLGAIAASIITGITDDAEILRAARRREAVARATSN